MMLGDLIPNYYTARDEIVAECGGPVNGIDLIEVLALALTNGHCGDMSLDEVRQTVFAVQRQRQESLS